MASALDILQKAQSLQEGDTSRLNKRPRSAAPASSAASSQELTAVFERVVRLSLSNAEKNEAVASATNLVLLVKQDSDVQQIQSQATLWVNSKPDWRPGASDNRPHELGEKRVFMPLVFLQLMQNDTTLEGDPVKKALQHLLSLPPGDLSRWVGSFKPRYAEPKSGRAWVWELSCSSLIPEDTREAHDALCKIIDNSRWKVAPHRWGTSSLGSDWPSQGCLGRFEEIVQLTSRGVRGRTLVLFIGFCMSNWAQRLAQALGSDRFGASCLAFFFGLKRWRFLCVFLP